MLVKRRGFQLWLLQMWVDIMKRRGLTITFILHEIVHYGYPGGGGTSTPCSIGIAWAGRGISEAVA